MTVKLARRSKVFDFLTPSREDTRFYPRYKVAQTSAGAALKRFNPNAPLPGPFAKPTAALRPLDALNLYRQAYPELMRFAQLHPLPGLLTLLIDSDGQTLSHLWLDATDSAMQSFCVGRDPRCEIVAPRQFDKISGHHLLVAKWVDNLQVPHLRVADLRSSQGFSDERGRVLDALDSTAPLFLKLNELSLLVLPCGPGLLNFADADSAYHALPRRQYTDEATHGGISVDMLSQLKGHWEDWRSAWQVAALRAVGPGKFSPGGSKVAVGGPVPADVGGPHPRYQPGPVDPLFGRR